MKKKFLFAVLVLLLAGVYGVVKRSGAPAGAPAKPAIPIMAEPARVEDVPVMLELVGRTEAHETVTLRSRVEGQVLDVAFREGQHVQKGDVLLRLDPADYSARLKQAEAGWVKARLDLKRYQELKEKGFVSAEKVIEMTATADAQAAAAELARLQLSYTIVRAPFEGIVGARLVFPGAAVKANDTALVTVNRVRPLFATFTVAEKYLPALRSALAGPGLSATVAPPGNAEAAQRGAVQFIDNAVDRATGTIQLKARLENPGEALLPGQFVNVSLVLDTLKNSVTVSERAVQQGQNGMFVFVVKPDHSVELRPVEMVSVYRGRAAIAKGLTGGETVVTEGQLRLVPGAQVQIKTPEPAKP